MAADASTVADAARESGFYLDSGVSVTEDDATRIVTGARNNGSRFHLVVLDDTPPRGNAAFAEAIFEDLAIPDGTVVVLSPEGIGWVTEGDGFTEDAMSTALDFANSEGGNDAEYSANFVAGLVGTSLPTENGSETTADSSSGGGFIWFVLIIAGVGLLVFWLIRRSGQQTVNAAAEQMAKARMAVQQQVDAVANDILDIEEEVRVSDNSEVDQFYNDAGATYQRVTEQLLEAESPQQVLELSNDLDTAIWQLDSAEAVLDGNPKPPRPEPKRLEPVASSSQDRVTMPARRPGYQRRPSRRSSYLGPGMLEMLIGVAGQTMAGDRRRTRRRSLGPVRRSTSRSTRRQTSRRSSGGRIRGGGRRRK